MSVSVFYLLPSSRPGWPRKYGIFQIKMFKIIPAGSVVAVFWSSGEIKQSSDLTADWVPWCLLLSSTIKQRLLVEMPDGAPALIPPPLLPLLPLMIISVEATELRDIYIMNVEFTDIIINM